MVTVSDPKGLDCGSKIKYTMHPQLPSFLSGCVLSSSSNGVSQSLTLRPSSMLHITLSTPA